MSNSGHLHRTWDPAAIVVIALFGVAAPALAGDPDPGCPGTNRVTCSSQTYDVWTPTFETECETAIGFGSSAYDYPAGSVRLTGYTIFPIGVHLIDSFTFHGPATGTPITFGLRVHYDVFLSSPQSRGHLFLEPFHDEPGDVPQFINFTGPSPPNHFVGTLVMTLTRPAGAPIGLEIDANLTVGGLDSGNGDFTFDFELPPGVRVTSCNGYVQDAPVPAVSASWGAMKAAYR